jgi:hypothetical protein
MSIYETRLEFKNWHAYRGLNLALCVTVPPCSTPGCLMYRMISCTKTYDLILYGRVVFLAYDRQLLYSCHFVYIPCRQTPFLYM